MTTPPGLPSAHPRTFVHVRSEIGPGTTPPWMHALPPEAARGNTPWADAASPGLSPTLVPGGPHGGVGRGPGWPPPQAAPLPIPAQRPAPPPAAGWMPPAVVPPAGVPAHLASVLHAPRRPGTATAAGVLWIVLGAVIALWSALVGFAAADGAVVVRTGDTALPADPTSWAVAAAVGAVVGIALVVLAALMLRGSAVARTVVTVLGAATMIALLPIVLVVPAMITQLHPSTGAWLADATRRRRAGRA